MTLPMRNVVREFCFACTLSQVSYDEFASNTLSMGLSSFRGVSIESGYIFRHLVASMTEMCLCRGFEPVKTLRNKSVP